MMKKQRFCKSTVSLLLVFMMLVSMLTVGIVNTSAAETDTAQTGATITGGTTFYLKPNTNWKSDGARFAANFCNGSSASKWYSAQGPNADGYYWVTVGSGESHNNIIWCRMNPNNTTNDWNNGSVWNQTNDLTWDGTKNLYTVAEGAWSKGDGSWSKYSDGASTTVDVYLAGSFNGWSTTALKFENGVAKVTLDENTTYQFKIVKDGDWLSKKGTMTSSDCTDWTFDTNVSDNCQITTTVKGDYTFNFDSNTNKLSVTYATETINPDDPDTVKIYVRDDCSSWEIEGDDANFFAKGNDGKIRKMTQTVDAITGKVLWYVTVPKADTKFTFYRASYFCDETNVANKPWNTWTTGDRGTNVCFNITGSGNGSWLSNSTVKVKPADNTDPSNFWYGLWVDTAGINNTKMFVRADYDGNNFKLYLPSYVDLNNVRLYSSFKTTTLKGGAYPNGTPLTQGAPTTVTLAENTNYTINATNDNNSAFSGGTLKVYKTTDTASMLLTTKEELFTGKTSGLADGNAWPDNSVNGDNYSNVYKEAIETSGNFIFMSEKGVTQQTQEQTVLKKIKGRGNSTFEASMKIYGKYAYNINLGEKMELIEGATASKKWCLLANNPDVTMMRNTFIYSLAEDVGLVYAPKTRFIDLYDNGKYLGAYILAEKVEYGKNTLMNDMINLDDKNEKANENADGDYIFDKIAELTQATTTYTYNNKTYTYQYSKSATSDYTYNTPEDYKQSNFLLEFELFSRYKNEASWFVSPRTGQAVVVKYPEFATQEEMKWIIEEYEQAESAIYDNNSNFDAISAAVDVDSFARMYLLQELSLNLDSGATSYFIHNDVATGKLVASTVWDYDWSMGAYMNKSDSGRKYVYNGSTVSVNSTTLDNPEQMFVKKKALKTDSGDNTKTNNYNFQAKLVQNSKVWERCQYYWTNLFVPNLNRYVDNDYIGSDPKKDDGETEGRMLTEWLPRFRSSMAMNDARWGSVSFTGDDWGTKITANYDPRSFEFYVGENKAGSKTKSYDNAVYYLNDWIVERWNYMSSSKGGALYNEDLKETITVENVDFEGTVNAGELTITPSATVTFEKGGTVTDVVTEHPETITYEVYVNEQLTAKSTYNNQITVLLSPGDNNVYIKVYITNAPNTYNVSETKHFAVDTGNYKVLNTDFSYVQNDGAVTVTPIGEVVYGDTTINDPNAKSYSVYVNGEKVATKKFSAGSTTVTIKPNINNEIYIEVFPTAAPSVVGTSDTKTFTYYVEVDKVDLTLFFKSSSSYRYIPEVKVNGGEKITMTRTGSAIGKNSSQTQSYYWYTCDVQVPANTPTTIVFENSYSMYATTTVTLSELSVRYFAVDNLNDGIEVVDLTDFDENIKNVTQSAAHMVVPSVEDKEVAKTSIGGTIYKLGDTTTDNQTNVFDATELQLALAEKIKLSELGEDLADFNVDATTSIMDVTQIQMYIAR